MSQKVSLKLHFLCRTVLFTVLGYGHHVPCCLHPYEKYEKEILSTEDLFLRGKKKIPLAIPSCTGSSQCIWGFLNDFKISFPLFISLLPSSSAPSHPLREGCHLAGSQFGLGIQSKSKSVCGLLQAEEHL